jgi:hypothetical protein
MERTRIIDRIRKLRNQALATNSIPEAQSFIAKAIEIQTKHGITSDELHPRPEPVPMSSPINTNPMQVQAFDGDGRPDQLVARLIDAFVEQHRNPLVRSIYVALKPMLFPQFATVTAVRSKHGRQRSSGRRIRR